METNEITQAPATEMLFEEPYNAIQPELKALSPAELLAITIDIPAAVSTVLGVQPKVLALGDRIAKLPEFDVALPAKLSVYAMALAHAQTLYSMASAPASAIKPLSDEGAALREMLLADATALVQRQLMDGHQLDDLKGPVGYKNLAFDLHMLAQAFRNAAAAVEGKCATQPAEIRRAEEIAAALLKLAGLQEQGPDTVSLISDIRSRAFTLFVKAYEDIRRAVTYLRWHEHDVDHITPSLYAGRGGKRKTDVPAPKPPASSPGAPTPPPDGGQAAPGSATPMAISIESAGRSL